MGNRAQSLSDFDTDVKSLTTLVIPLRGHRLILPMVAIAEFDAIDGLPVEPKSRRPYHYREYRWHEVPIPLIDLDVLIWDAKPMSSYRYICVLHSQKAETEKPFWGLVTQGIPETKGIEYKDLILKQSQPQDYLHAEVALENDVLYIPDLVKIEGRL